jgi:hypothetical protein
MVIDIADGSFEALQGVGDEIPCENDEFSCCLSFMWVILAVTMWGSPMY